MSAEPRVITRNGTQCVVGATGEELVCRGNNQHTGGTGRRYHRIDTETYSATGMIRPACGDIAHHHDADWVLRQRLELEPIWTGCSYQACYGEYDPSDPAPKASGHNELAATLEAMSVEEFDAIVDHHRAARTDGGR